MSSGKYAFWCPVALIRPSRSACSSSHIRYPYGLITMLPRTGPRSTSSARKTTSLYQAEKSSLCGVTLRSSRATIFRLPSRATTVPATIPPRAGAPWWVDEGSAHACLVVSQAVCRLMLCVDWSASHLGQRRNTSICWFCAEIASTCLLRSVESVVSPVFVVTHKSENIRSDLVRRRLAHLGTCQV